MRIDHERCVHRQQQRVTIRRCLRDVCSRNLKIAASLVFNDYGLAPNFGQPFSERTCDKIDQSAGRDRNNDVDLSAWIGLRRSNARETRKRGSAGCQMQKSTAGRFWIHHVRAPRRVGLIRDGKPEMTIRAILTDLPGLHSALMPANFTTLPHFSVSSAMSLPKSAGEPPSA